MANDNKVGKKTLRKSSSNLSLFENFSTNECIDTCKLKPKRQAKPNRRSQISNENMYLIIIIVILLLVSWFKK